MGTQNYVITAQWEHKGICLELVLGNAENRFLKNTRALDTFPIGYRGEEIGPALKWEFDHCCCFLRDEVMGRAGIQQGPQLHRADTEHDLHSF
jgi:hypothetical protein